MTITQRRKNRGDRKDRRENVIVVLSLLCVLCGVFCFSTPAAAQTYQVIGKAKCINCHDHENEKVWSEKKDGPPPNNHLNALRQLESTKSEPFAKAIGLADPYDPKGSCATCHGTTLKGAVVDGVTCESCHGPASGYVDVHQQKGAYRQSVAAGLADTQKNPDAWAPMCVKCHVLKDAKLIQAGHPSGDDFDLGAKFATVALHWKSVYANKADITARARNARAAIVAARGPMAAPAVATPAAAAAPPPPAATVSAAPVAAPVPTTPVSASPAAPVSNAPARAVVAQRAASPAAGLPIQPVLPIPPSIPVAVLAMPLSPSAAVAAVQGRLIAMLDSLLRRDARAVVKIAPPPPAAYAGPDAELLRLQDEVLSLALESLATPPAAKKP
jgi:hypothetical protein